MDDIMTKLKIKKIYLRGSQKQIKEQETGKKIHDKQVYKRNKNHPIYLQQGYISHASQMHKMFPLYPYCNFNSAKVPCTQLKVVS